MNFTAILLFVLLMQFHIFKAQSVKEHGYRGIISTIPTKDKCMLYIPKIKVALCDNVNNQSTQIMTIAFEYELNDIHHKVTKLFVAS